MEQKYIDLYDEYTHGDMGRRHFLDRLIKLAGGLAVALVVLPELENNYLNAATSEFTNIVSDYVEFEGASGKVKAYLAKPKKFAGKIPAVVIIHENRGLNPHIEDVTRRAAAAGFLALAPDGLSALGGTPKDMDQARELIGKLNREKTIGDFVAAVEYMRDYESSNGNVGCAGFCWGGSMANQLSVKTEAMKAAVAFYGGQAKSEDVPKIKGALMLHYAELDERINAGIPDYKSALEKAGIDFEIFTYAGANHAFHNDTNAARYDKSAAELAWQRTVEFWKKHLVVKESQKNLKTTKKKP